MAQVAVIGAGTMGNGIAHVFAQYGFKVQLIDVNEAQLQKALATITKNMDRQVAKGVISEADKQAALANLSLETNLAKGVASADLVVEAATENVAIKLDIFKQIDAAAPAHCILASNTSSISITKIGAATQRPNKVIGMHFMNPVPMKPMVETIRGYHTSDETIETAKKLLAQMGKECILVNDSPGFVSNRVLMLTINEAIFILQEQVASASEVDRIFKTCFGHKMGPLETADLIG
ncbi:MAG TPA: 3-hydroxybutyryl-CoA dehydrogenase, partial [Chitinophagaceae bacterium]|nr:3-hydroxybutyryl-CoA dehydrogenase [Chitinophagaceae bacterium]